jgi:hypothetical protein
MPFAVTAEGIGKSLMQIVNVGFGDIYIAEQKADFDGWQILAVEDWKPGVKRVHMRQIEGKGSGRFQIVYADEALTKDLVVTQ